MATTLSSTLLIPQTSKKPHSHPLVSANPHFPTGFSPIKPKLSLEAKGTIHHRIYHTRAPWLPHCTKRSIGSGEPDPDLDPLHASDTIVEFYELINAKNLRKVQALISEDCYFEELSFAEPFQGRTEVMNFLTELADGMGDHTKFKTEMVYEGDDKSTVGLMWHLEWKEKQLPFTRGCSFYQCAKEGKKLVIKKARVVIESPVKPGVFVLKLLKVVSSVFDQFPNLTERLLLKPHIVVMFLHKIYKIFMEPLILPVLLYYSHIWTFAARLMGCFFNILLKILKGLKWFK